VPWSSVRDTGGVSERAVGRYELHEVLGSGGFATVYRATDPRLDAIVAVKLLAENWSHHPEVRRRFRNEAVLLRRVQSDGAVAGIVEVFDIDESAEGQPFFVMGYADRGTLADRIDGRLWSVDDVAPVVDSLATTVGALHEAGVIHRDLKPSNLLIRSDRLATEGTDAGLLGRGERLVVGDLGLAKDLTDDSSTLSLAGGTARYMAPEQVDPGRVVTPAADVYAASCVVTELIFGRDALATRATPSADHAANPVWSVVQRGLADDPDQRFESMKKWREALHESFAIVAAADITAVSAQPASDPVPAQPLAPAPPLVPAPPLASDPEPARARTPLLVAGAACLLALVAVIAVVVTGGDDSSIIGPDTIEVGEVVRYRSETEPGESVRWIDSNNIEIGDADLQVQALLPGLLTFELVVDGDVESKTVRVEESALGPSIDGPGELEVGEAGRFSAETQPGDGSFYWIDPSGTRVDGGDLEVTPTSAGRLTISLVAVGADGVERGTVRMVEAGS